MCFLSWRLSQQATTFLLRIQENSVRKRKPTVLTALWSLIMLNIYRRHILCSVLISYWTAIKYRGCTRPSSRGILSFWMEKMWSWCRWQRWRASHSIFGFHVNWVGWVVEISSWVLVYKSQFRSNRRISWLTSFNKYLMNPRFRIQHFRDLVEFILVHECSLVGVQL